MDQNLKQLFLQTTSSSGAIRNAAESQLKSLEKNTEFLNYVRNVLMKDQDRILQQISSLYFMNAIEKHWKTPELKGVITDLENNILSLLLIEDKYPKLAYQKILQCALENSNKKTILQIFTSSGDFLSSEDIHQNRAALTLFEEVFGSDSLRFNMEDILDVMFNTFGAVFTTKFTGYLVARKFSCAGSCMKILTKSYSQYRLPVFLDTLNVFTGYVQLAIQILNMKGETGDGFQKMQKWAAVFIYKAANKGLKKYYKNAVFVQFIRDPSTLELFYNTFNKLLNDYITQSPLHSRIPVIVANFFSLFAGSKRARQFIKGNYMLLISSFILPVQSYDEDMKDAFENEEDTYLQARYNFFNGDLRSATTELFDEILRCDKEIEISVISSMKMFLDSGINEANAATIFGVIGLLADSQRSFMRSISNEEFHQFLVGYIFPALDSPYLFLRSQALYFLSLTESIEIVDGHVYEALKKIFDMTNGDNNILSVEACLSLNAFFYIKSLHPLFKPIIPSLFEKILAFTKKYFLESLSTLCDSIIDCFTDEITNYAPLFVQTICSSFMDHIESEKNDKLATISGCLSTIEKLVMTADDKPEIVLSIYQSVSTIIYYVFKNQKVDFFQECFDLMNSFFYVLRCINESMFEIFVLSLSVNKEELCLYPREICDYIDNFLTYGGEQIIIPKTLELIYNCIDIFMPINSEECEIYDEDIEAACRIIDSLMLNCGRVVHQLNQNLIPALLHKIITNYDFIATYDSLPVFALNSIENCFIISPEIALNTLSTFTESFFSELDAHKNKFIRVYDKKLFLLFVGSLFKLKVINSIRYESFCALLAHTIATLPDAIKKRNKLKEKEEKKRDISDEEDDDDDSECEAGAVYEDIYFETILDKFDAFAFTRDTLSSISPGTVGERVIATLNSSQVAQIKQTLESPHEEQK